eukprot:6183333-Pleurochrysis_carterae.AAC.2
MIDTEAAKAARSLGAQLLDHLPALLDDSGVLGRVAVGLNHLCKLVGDGSDKYACSSGSGRRRRACICAL